MTDQSDRRSAARAVFSRQVGGPPARRTSPTTAETNPAGNPTTTQGRTVARPSTRPEVARPSEAPAAATRVAKPMSAELPGAKVRHRQVMTVYLPEPEREHLYAVAAEQGVSLGKAAIDALRDGYDRLEESMKPIPASRFPDERPRQRSRLDNPLQVSLSISAAQAAAVGDVLDTWGCTASELFTAALRLRLS